MCYLHYETYTKEVKIKWIKVLISSFCLLALEDIKIKRARSSEEQRLGSFLWRRVRQLCPVGRWGRLSEGAWWWTPFLIPAFLFQASREQSPTKARKTPDKQCWQEKETNRGKENPLPSVNLCFKMYSEFIPFPPFKTAKSCR